jgi:V/A-type H+-transporting ATPase subunit I
MLSTVPITKLICIFHTDDKEAVAERLHELGVAEIEFLDESDLVMFEISRDSPTERAHIASSWILRIGKLIEALAPFEKKEGSFLDDLLGVERITRVEVEGGTLEEAVALGEKITGEIERDVNELVERLKDIESKISDEETKLVQCERLRIEDFRIEWLGESRFLYVAVATIPPEGIPLVGQVMEKNGLDPSFMIMHFVEGTPPLIVVVSLKEDRVKVDKSLQAVGAERISIDGEGTLSEVKRKAQETIKKLKAEREEIVDRLSSIASEHLDTLRAVEEVFRLYKSRYEIFTNNGKTKKTSVMSCFVETSRVREVEKTINEATGGACIISTEEDPPDAPSKLENPAFAKPFEMLTRTYGIPKYNHVDPTLFLIPTFLAFTGMMINDFAYGAIIALAGFFLYKKYALLSQSVKELSLLILFCGISAMVFGVLTGNYFGDLVGKYVVGGVGAEDVALWIDPLEVPEHGLPAVIFLYRIIVFVGLMHLILGLVLGIYTSVRNSEFGKAFFHFGGWLMFGIALSILLFTEVGELLAFPSVLPSFMMYVGGAIAVVGIVLAMKYEPVITLVEIPTFIAFMLSYARVLGLMVAAGGVALAFNKLSAIAFESLPFLPAAVLLAVFVFLFGHVVHLLLGSLSAFIQSLRLHYVEHFSRYYEGGGREFQPFCMKCVHALIRRKGGV